MTILANQVDGVIKAYNKQYKNRFSFENGAESSRPDRYADVVTLSRYEDVRGDVEAQMTYNLVDILKRQSK
ncbi:MAG: hypothetical protein NTV58_15705 [Deltaproteobacteria bacterium]|nr:hypothetical protein [Deltaproteobacteria bacterium]